MQKEIDSIFSEIIQEIIDGSSLRACLRVNGRPSSSTFYEWIDSDDNKAKQYARATEDRQEKIFDEILEIADKQGEDIVEVCGEQIINHNVINRNRLQIDARKWALSKMNPKKYGDKVDLTSDGDKLGAPVIDYSKLSAAALKEIESAEQK